jgi:hypothetical protein
MVSPLEKSGRKRLGRVLPPVEISALAAARQGHFAELRRPARRRVRRATFIAELDVYSQSKGRTPNVFVFNPFAEARIAEGKTFNPAKHQAQLARDLENLPQFLCAGRMTSCWCRKNRRWNF